MNDSSGYVKRFKSLSLLVIGITLLTYDVVHSSKNLDADFSNLKNIFIASQLLKAYIPGNGEISEVDGQTAAAWLATMEGTLPERGLVVNIIKSWNKPALQIEGSFKLSNEEVIKFTRLSGDRSIIIGQSCKLHSKTQGLAPDQHKPVCHAYSLREDDDTEFSHNFLLVFKTNQKLGASQARMSLLYADESSNTLFLESELESKIMRISLPWVGSVKNTESAYFALRDKLQQRTIKLPVINYEVRINHVAIFLATFTLVISSLMAHSILAISNISVTGSNEPWILQVPGYRKDDWASLLQLVLSYSGAAVIISIIWCPVIIVALTLNMNESTWAIFPHWLILVVTIVFSTATSIKICSILSSLHIQGTSNRS